MIQPDQDIAQSKGLAFNPQEEKDRHKLEFVIVQPGLLLI